MFSECNWRGLDRGLVYYNLFDVQKYGTDLVIGAPKAINVIWIAIDAANVKRRASRKACYLIKFPIQMYTKMRDIPWLSCSGTGLFAPSFRLPFHANSFPAIDHATIQPTNPARAMLQHIYKLMLMSDFASVPPGRGAADDHGMKVVIHPNLEL